MSEYTYSSMCRMDHTMIGHNLRDGDERCPICRLLDMLVDLGERYHWTEDDRAAVKRLVEQLGAQAYTISDSYASSPPSLNDIR